MTFSVFFSISAIADRSCALLSLQTLRRRSSSSLQPTECMKSFSVAAVPLVTSAENALDPFKSVFVFPQPGAEAMLRELSESQDGVNFFATDLLE